MRLTFSQFCDVVRQAVESLPEPFQAYLDNVVVDVFDEPSAEDLAAAEDREDDTGDTELLGLFIGVALTEQSYGDRRPNVVKIFRGPLERMSRSRQALLQNIRATVLHELAHHFGYSEEDLEDFERSQDQWL